MDEPTTGFVWTTWLRRCVKKNLIKSEVWSQSYVPTKLDTQQVSAQKSIFHHTRSFWRLSWSEKMHVRKISWPDFFVQNFCWSNKMLIQTSDPEWKIAGSFFIIIFRSRFFLPGFFLVSNCFGSENDFGSKQFVGPNNSLVRTWFWVRTFFCSGKNADPKMLVHKKSSKKVGRKKVQHLFWSGKGSGNFCVRKKAGPIFLIILSRCSWMWVKYRLFE